MLTTFPPPIENDQETALVLHPEALRLRQLATRPVEAEIVGRDLDFLDALLRRWLLALGLFVGIGTIGTLLVSKIVRPEFENEALIFLAPDLVQAKSWEIQSNYHVLVNQQVITILHDDTLEDAIRRLALKNIAWRTKGESEQQAITRLRNKIDVHAVPDSYEIGVSTVNPDPAEAAAIANAVAETFVDRFNRLGSIGDGDTPAGLNAEREALNQQLQSMLEVRGQLAKSLELINHTDGRQIPLDEVLSQTRQTLADVHYKRLEAEANLANNNIASAKSEVDSDLGPVATSLLARRAVLRQRIEGMLPTHPVRKQVEGELAEIDRELNLTGDKSGSSTPESKRRQQAQVQAYRQIEQNLSGDLSKQSGSIPSRAKNLEEVQLVNSEIQRLQSRLSQVEERSDNIKLRKISGAVRIFSAAMPPGTQKKSRKTKILICVWLSAAFIAAFAPLLLDGLDARVYRSEEVESVLGMPVIGLILRSNPRLNGFASEQLARSAASLARLIKQSPNARSIFVSGLKCRCDPSFVGSLAAGLSKFDIDARVCTEVEVLDRGDQTLLSPTQLPSAEASAVREHKSTVLFNGPPLLFSAEAERLAAESEILLIVVQSGLDTHRDLSHCVRILKRLNQGQVAVLVNDVQLQRAGRQLKSEVRSYLAAFRSSV
jgi:capsular polysaccharide biosynthesis protein